MSELKKHNVETYLKACGMWKKVTEDYNANVIINLMEGYAQLYHNNQVKQANEASTSHNKALDIDLVSHCGLTEGEQEERRDLMILRADSTRFFHQCELDRLNEINDKMFKNSKNPHRG